MFQRPRGLNLCVAIFMLEFSSDDSIPGNWGVPSSGTSPVPGLEAQTGEAPVRNVSGSRTGGGGVMRAHLQIRLSTTESPCKTLRLYIGLCQKCCVVGRAARFRNWMHARDREELRCLHRMRPAFDAVDLILRHTASNCVAALSGELHVFGIGCMLATL